MKVTIRNIDKTIFDGQASEVILPGLYGKIGVKPNHAAMSVILTTGEIYIHSTNQNEKFLAVEGIAHVDGNLVNILLTD